MTAVPQAAEPEYSIRGGVSALTYPGLTRPNVEHGIAVFRDLVTGPPGPDAVRTLTRALRTNLEPAPGCLIIPIQKHASVVRQVGWKDCEGIPVESDAPATTDGPMASGGPVTCDGLVTAEGGVMIAISVADCIPLFALDTGGAAIGLAHCGWRGIASGIVEEFAGCVGGLASRPANVVYLIGASIGVCCYDVRSDFLAHFSDEEVEAFSTTTGHRTCFDLKPLLASRLIRSGVGAGQISIDNTCTSCKKYLLSSYRADGTKCGRMLAYLMKTE
jgi:YfiH family protein